MFFTVRKIDGFVINIDDFEHDDALLTQILAELRPAYQLAFTSQKGGDVTRFGIAPADVFSAQSLFELSMYQNVFRRAIIKMGTTPSSTVYICRNSALLRNAHELLLGTIVMVPPGTSDASKLTIIQEFPDFLLDTVAELKECLCGGDVGFGGEFTAAPPGVFIFNRAHVRTCRFPRVPNLKHPDCPVYVAGRYFGSSDPRHKLHALSARIVSSKWKPEAQAACFADLFIRGAWWASGNNIDLITRVPPHPGKKDRLLLYMNEIPKTTTFKTNNLNAQILRPDLLQCNSDYPKMTSLSYANRPLAVSGAFQASESVVGRNIVLLDDVQTTGATLNECISVLKKAGAKSVLPLVLGYHPYELQTLGLTDDHEMHCKCNSKLIAKCRNDGVPFFGCASWKQFESHSTKDFDKGLIAKLELLEPHLMQMDEELQSEGFQF